MWHRQNMRQLFVSCRKHWFLETGNAMLDFTIAREYACYEYDGVVNFFFSEELV